MSITDFDVETLRGRRADRRWNRTSVGDLLERVTWFERMTYRQADEAANQVAHALLGEGLEPGDRVLLYCDNSVEAILLFFGIAKAGTVAVPVDRLKNVVSPAARTCRASGWRLVFATELPRTVGGKIRKHELRKELS